MQVSPFSMAIAHSSPSAVSRRSSCTQRHTQKVHVCWGAHAGQTHAVTRRAQRFSTATSVRSIAWESEEWTKTELHIVLYWSVYLSSYLSAVLSSILSLCPSVSLSVLSIVICMSVCLSVLSVGLSIVLSFCPSLCCSIYLFYSFIFRSFYSVCLSLSRSLCQLFCLAVILFYLSFYQSECLCHSIYCSRHADYLFLCLSFCCCSISLSFCLSGLCRLELRLESLFLLCSQNPFIFHVI